MMTDDYEIPLELVNALTEEALAVLGIQKDAPRIHRHVSSHHFRRSNRDSHGPGPGHPIPPTRERRASHLFQFDPHLLERIATLPASEQAKLARHVISTQVALRVLSTALDDDRDASAVHNAFQRFNAPFEEGASPLPQPSVQPQAILLVTKEVVRVEAAIIIQRAFRRYAKKCRRQRDQAVSKQASHISWRGTDPLTPTARARYMEGTFTSSVRRSQDSRLVSADCSPKKLKATEAKAWDQEEEQDGEDKHAEDEHEDEYEDEHDEEDGDGEGDEMGEGTDDSQQASPRIVLKHEKTAMQVAAAGQMLNMAHIELERLNTLQHQRASMCGDDPSSPWSPSRLDAIKAKLRELAGPPAEETPPPPPEPPRAEVRFADLHPMEKVRRAIGPMLEHTVNASSSRKSSVSRGGRSGKSSKRGGSSSSDDDSDEADSSDADNAAPKGAEEAATDVSSRPAGGDADGDDGVVVKRSEIFNSLMFSGGLALMGEITAAADTEGPSGVAQTIRQQVASVQAALPPQEVDDYLLEVQQRIGDLMQQAAAVQTSAQEMRESIAAECIKEVERIVEAAKAIPTTIEIKEPIRPRDTRTWRLQAAAEWEAEMQRLEEEQELEQRIAAGFGEDDEWDENMAATGTETDDAHTGTDGGQGSRQFASRLKSIKVTSSSRRSSQSGSTPDGRSSPKWASPLSMRHKGLSSLHPLGSPRNMQESLKSALGLDAGPDSNQGAVRSAPNSPNLGGHRRLAGPSARGPDKHPQRKAPTLGRETFFPGVHVSECRDKGLQELGVHEWHALPMPPKAAPTKLPRPQKAIPPPSPRIPPASTTPRLAAEDSDGSASPVNLASQRGVWQLDSNGSGQLDKVPSPPHKKMGSNCTDVATVQGTSLAAPNSPLISSTTQPKPATAWPGTAAGAGSPTRASGWTVTTGPGHQAVRVLQISDEQLVNLGPFMAQIALGMGGSPGGLRHSYATSTNRNASEPNGNGVFTAPHSVGLNPAQAPVITTPWRPTLADDGALPRSRMHGSSPGNFAIPGWDSASPASPMRPSTQDGVATRHSIEQPDTRVRSSPAHSHSPNRGREGAFPGCRSPTPSSPMNSTRMSMPSTTLPALASTKGARPATTDVCGRGGTGKQQGQEPGKAWHTKVRAAPGLMLGSGGPTPLQRGQSATGVVGARYSEGAGGALNNMPPVRTSISGVPALPNARGVVIKPGELLQGMAVTNLTADVSPGLLHLPATHSAPQTQLTYTDDHPGLKVHPTPPTDMYTSQLSEPAYGSTTNLNAPGRSTPVDDILLHANAASKPPGAAAGAGSLGWWQPGMMRNRQKTGGVSKLAQQTTTVLSALSTSLLPDDSTGGGGVTRR